MITLLVETIWGFFQLTAWVGLKIVQFAGGLLLGHMRTRIDQRGYQPAKLGAPHELDLDVATFVITMPKSHTWKAETTFRFVSHLIDLGRCLLQIVADSSGISFRVVFIDGIDETNARAAITAFYPESRVTVVPYTRTIDSFPRYGFFMPLLQANIFPAPILTVDQIKYFDPLLPLTQAISELAEGERVVYTVAVLDAAVGAAEAGFRLITTTDIHPIAYTDFTGIYIAEIRKAKGLVH